MPSLKAIRRRITSVKNTQKITRAMKLVAAARLRKAQQRAQDLRPYARKVTEVLGNVAAAVGDLGDLTPPLLQVRVDQLMPVKPTGGAGEGGGADFIYEPDRTALLEKLLPMYVETMLYRAMLESVASEHGARMTAMDNATKNAKEMIGTLTLSY